MSFVFDSGAIIALFRDEEGADVVQRLLLDAGQVRLVHAVNLCEVYYGFRRERDEREAQRVVEALTATGVTVREDMDRAFWEEAGRYKSDLARISLADCFCLTLARRTDSEIVTTDHNEFGKVAEQGLCGVRFVR